jgi:hypothetical protein
LEALRVEGYAEIRLDSAGLPIYVLTPKGEALLGGAS